MPRMLGVFATLVGLAVFSAAPAAAQTVVDGSGARVQSAHLAGLIDFVGGYPDLGAQTQIRGLHGVTVSGAQYYCGQVRVTGSWEPFYYDPYAGRGRHGIVATAICGN
jgi:hypothetical protein